MKQNPITTTILLAIIAGCCLSLWWTISTDGAAMSAKDEQVNTLKADVDSLLSDARMRDAREIEGINRADRLHARFDSLVANAPTPKDRYIRLREVYNAWDTDSLLLFLGAWPSDTDTSRHARSLGHH
jgi:hypothetical protein